MKEEERGCSVEMAWVGIFFKLEILFLIDCQKYEFWKAHLAPLYEEPCYLCINKMTTPNREIVPLEGLA